ncbi:MAG: sulfite exporter TauE/SafE family protein [Thermodesulfobacteriota bacterium]
MYFPVANIEVNPIIPPLVAFCISFFTSMGGVSGAFLLLPFQVSVLGFTSPAVSSTNQLYNIVAIPSGVYRYIREDRMVWPLTWVVIIGTLPGVLVGAILRIKYLPDPRNFKVFAAMVLLYIGIRLISDLVARKKGGPGQETADQRFQRLVREYQAEHGSNRLPGVTVKECNLARVRYEFLGEECQASSMGILTLSLVVGVIGGVYGIGGGAIIAPFFVSIFGLPVHTVAGAALMGTFVTSVAGVAFYQLIAPWFPNMAVAPDWLLGVLFGVGGFAGMYCGARLQRFVPARAIKWMLAGFVLFTALKYLFEFFV